MTPTDLPDEDEVMKNNIRTRMREFREQFDKPPHDTKESQELYDKWCNEEDPDEEELKWYQKQWLDSDALFELWEDVAKADDLAKELYQKVSKLRESLGTDLETIIALDPNGIDQDAAYEGVDGVDELKNALRRMYEKRDKHTY